VTSLGRALLGLLAAALAGGCGTDPPSSGNATDGPVRPRVSASPAVPSGAKTGTKTGPRTPEPTRAEKGGRAFRPADDRPRHDDASLAALGIRKFVSRRLLLYSDIPAAKAERLPPLVDAAYDAWVAYFGDLPPARDGAEYQLTGYLIGDLDLFRSAGLVPEGVTFEHGRHRGQEFWMRDQEYDYYRAHLLIHEATHCFMTAVPGSNAGPVWYMEGMAERFGTHRDGGAATEFRTMPASPEETAGFGRITLVREEVEAGRFKPLDDVFALKASDFVQTPAYAWSWAACAFLDTHPRYRERFRELGDPKLRWVLDRELRDRFATDRADLDAEWAVFAHSLRYGYDLERAAVEFRAGEALPSDGASFKVKAERGWQSSGVRVAVGQRYAVSAEGRFTLADDPKPWSSEADGITFDYFDGRPLGRLTAAVCSNSVGTAADGARGLLSPIDVGRKAEIVAPFDGTLYFRVNDGWDRLGDNRGELTVTVRPAGN